MNDYADFSRSGGLDDFPPLECMPAENGCSSADDDQSDESNASCSSINILTPDGSPFIVGVDGDLWDYMELVWDCQFPGFFGGTPLPITPGNATWWDYVDMIIFVDLNESNSEQFVINTAKFFNSNADGNNFANNNGNGSINGSNNQGNNGEWKGPEFTLNKSLYSVGIVLKNGKYIPHVFETAAVVQNKNELANMLDINVFPNPLIDKKFNINFKAKATLKVEYRLKGFYGNELHRQTFVIHKDQDITHVINRNNIPTGLLYHQFLFEDGSQKSLQTIKY
ncbi:MAG: hypothetical protein HY738_05635 [Bacteroidia bacterium]|nr:hypothetical protein [Bacteroidia bacterium]